jgi:hypothetical protein
MDGYFVQKGLYQKQFTNNSKTPVTAGMQATVETHQQGNGVGNNINRAKAGMHTTARQHQRPTTAVARDACNNKHK